MRHIRVVVLGAGLTLATGIAVAMAGTPFGGDDSGQIPSSKSTLKCENSIGNAVGKAVVCFLKCDAARADGKLADDTAEDACEKNNAGKSCLEKFEATATKKQSKDTTGGCNCVNVPSIALTIEAIMDGVAGISYCDSSSGTHFGGEDTGFLPPPKSAIKKCEDKANKLVGKAVPCFLKCDAARADGKLADDTAEDACEKNNAGKSCAEKLEASVAKLKGCPSCVSGSNLARFFEGALDGINSEWYCASPSGAFLE